MVRFTSEGSVTQSQAACARLPSIEGERNMEVEENSSETPCVVYFAPSFCKCYLYNAKVIIFSRLKAAAI